MGVSIIIFCSLPEPLLNELAGDKGRFLALWSTFVTATFAYLGYVPHSRVTITS